MSKEFQHKLNEIEAKCEELIGERINLNSPKQLSRYFLKTSNTPSLGDEDRLFNRS